jgi:hypothetical protein
MSWSAYASGKPSEVRGQLSEQFKAPLAEKPAGLFDEGERQTVRLIADLLEQISTTIDSEGTMDVKAFGHMGSMGNEDRSGCYQVVNIVVDSKPKEGNPNPFGKVSAP